MENEFEEDLTKLVTQHDLENVVGVPKHIIVQIMISSLNNYCMIFRNLEEFYMALEAEKQSASAEG